MAPKPSIAEVKRLLTYDPATGVFTWNVYRCGQRKAGSIAGNVMANGYRQINIARCVLLAHRVAYFYMTGEWPSHHIDHKNGHRDDNRWHNIRNLPQEVNNQNIVRPHADNKSGFLGVSKGPSGTFQAYVCFQGKRKYLGSFEKPEEAHQAYLNKKRELHAGCTI